MRTHVEVSGARENNLQNVCVRIPRDQLVVVTGLSGSGKSSLAFDTVYAEGQRRLLASMSSYAKRFVSQLKKPDVDFVNGLSPVISIDQKTTGNNPRSTVGTMTDVWDYMRMLYATVGTPHCPLAALEGKTEPLSVRSPRQIADCMASLPDGAVVEVRAPVFRAFGDDYEDLVEQIRVHGCRRVRFNGELLDLGDELSFEEDDTYPLEAVVETFVIGPDIDRSVLAGLEAGLKLGSSCLLLDVESGSATKRQITAFQRKAGVSRRGTVSGPLHHGQFTFNDPEGACPTCAGLGTTKRVYPPLLVPDPSRSLSGGAFVKAAMNCDRNSWGGRMLNSLAVHYDFSLDVPYEQLPEDIVQILLYGTGAEKITIRIPEGARQGLQHEGKEVRFRGIVTNIEHQYQWYRRQGSARDGMEEHLNKVMVDNPCPECGGSRLKVQRRLVTVSGRPLHESGELNLSELLDFLNEIQVREEHTDVVQQVLREVRARIELLVEIGLDYLNLNRPSGTLSGGEAQRIRMASQIGSGLMGMLYVLDEPSIGLHPKDNTRMIATMRRLRDLGNTVLVVEHDEETIRDADHVIEIGPGPGIHGGEIVYEGSVDGMLSSRESLTGQYLSGRMRIDVPETRRAPVEGCLRIEGARANNLRNVTVELPLGVFTCITGASGSGKSTLIHEVLYKQLYSLLHDSRVLAGEHDALTGSELIDDVIHIDQSPIGRSPRSNPATYIGFYDHIRKLFASTEQSQQRGYTASRFSFNVKGGRCEECTGDGTIVTQLSFMPDVEVLCPTCKGARYNPETLEVRYRDQSISDVLAMSVEDGAEFFADAAAIHRRLAMMEELGLGYLTIGHPATILSGGEAQRVKLAAELSKLRRGKHNLYILDEPTTGLHFGDIQRLLDSLYRLVDQGHTVIVIEHNMDVIKTADHVIDLGPEGGHRGGQIVAQGTPEKVARSRKSHTGRYLREYLRSSS